MNIIVLWGSLGCFRVASTASLVAIIVTEGSDLDNEPSGSVKIF